MTHNTSFGDIKRQVLQDQRQALLEEYQAANAQLARTLSDVDRVRLVRQLRDLEQKIAQIEAESKQLDGSDEGESAIDSTPHREPYASSETSWTTLRQRPETLVGQTVLSYHLVELIGAGGSGLVYRGWQQTLGRSVAFKLFYPLASSYRSLYAAFENGFRALGALEHPNIIRIFDVGRVVVAGEETFYIAMEHVDGVPLDVWSAALDGPDAFRQRLAAAVALAEALDAAHNTNFMDQVGFQTRGVLHGDLKPANVLMARGGAVKLGDFLLVDVQRLLDPRIISPRALVDKRPITGAYGTPGFMAPEQERQGIVTVATDVYGLGMTLCHLFLPESVVPPYFTVMSGSAGNLPAELAGLLQEMVADRPELRPESMKVVVRQLQVLQKTHAVKPDSTSPAAGSTLAPVPSASPGTPTATMPPPTASPAAAKSGLAGSFSRLPDAGKAAVITGVFAVIVALITLLAQIIPPPNGPASAATPTPMAYVVRIEGQDSAGTGIKDAKVTLEVPGRPPLDTFTDDNGVAVLTVPAQYIGGQAVMIVEAAGFAPFRQNIAIDAGSLPPLVRLERPTQP